MQNGNNDQKRSSLLDSIKNGTILNKTQESAKPVTKTSAEDESNSILNAMAKVIADKNLLHSMNAEVDSDFSDDEWKIEETPIVNRQPLPKTETLKTHTMLENTVQKPGVHSHDTTAEEIHHRHNDTPINLKDAMASRRMHLADEDELYELQQTSPVAKTPASKLDTSKHSAIEGLFAKPKAAHNKEFADDMQPKAAKLEEEIIHAAASTETELIETVEDAITKVDQEIEEIIEHKEQIMEMVENKVAKIEHDIVEAAKIEDAILKAAQAEIAKVEEELIAANLHKDEVIEISQAVLANIEAAAIEAIQNEENINPEMVKAVMANIEAAAVEAIHQEVNAVENIVENQPDAAIIEAIHQEAEMLRMQSEARMKAAREEAERMQKIANSTPAPTSYSNATNDDKSKHNQARNSRFNI